MKITRVEQTPPPLSEQQFDVRLTGLELALIHVLTGQTCFAKNVANDIFVATEKIFGIVDSSRIFSKSDIVLQVYGIETLKELIDKK